MHLESVAIVGGGPVGSLLAFLLAKQGISSDVYERRAKPERTPSPNNTQAYLLNANSRTIMTLKENGISLDALVNRSGGQLTQKFLSATGNKYHEVGAKVTLENPMMMRVFRDEIARHIIDAAEQQFSDKIKFHWEATVKEVDLQNKKIAVSTASGQNEVSYELLVGADGAGSRVRAAVEKLSEPGFVKRRDHDTVYTTTLCDSPPGAFPDHTLFLLHAFEAGAVMVNGRGDGDVRAALFIPQSLAKQISAGDTEFMKKTLEHGLPGINAHGKKAISNILQDPKSFHPLSGWTYLNRLYGPSTLLIGDAAHTMTPMLGQGCNSGLEDARLFANELVKAQNLDAALKSYNALRWPDIQALLRLNEIAANERHLILSNESRFLHMLWVRVHAVMLGVHQIVGRTTHKLLPQVFGEPQLVKALRGKAPYRTVMPAMYRDTFLLSSVAILGVTGLYTLINRYIIS